MRGHVLSVRRPWGRSTRRCRACVEGASMAGGGLAMLIWGSAQGGPGWLQWVIVAVLGVLGAVVQFRTTREIK